MLLSFFFLNLIQDHNPNSQQLTPLFEKKQLAQEFSYLLNSYLACNSLSTEIVEELLKLKTNIQLFSSKFKLDFSLIIQKIDDILKNNINDLSQTNLSLDEQTYSFLLAEQPALEQYAKQNFTTSLLNNKEKFDLIIETIEKKITLTKRVLTKLHAIKDEKSLKKLEDITQRISDLEQSIHLLKRFLKNKSNKFLAQAIISEGKITLKPSYGCIANIFENNFSITTKIHFLELFLSQFTLTQENLFSCFFNVYGYFQENTPTIEALAKFLIVEKGLDPFFEVNGHCLYSYFPQMNIRDYLFEFAKQHLSSNTNNNENNNTQVVDIKKIIINASDKMKSGLISHLIYSDKTSTSPESLLFKHLLSTTPNWEDTILHVKDIEQESNEITLLIQKEKCSLNVYLPIMCNFLCYAIYYDNEDALNAMLNARKFDVIFIIQAISYAVTKNKMTMVDTLLNHFVLKDKKEKNKYEKWFIQNDGFFRVFFLIALYHKIPYSTLKKMLDKFSCQQLITDFNYYTVIDENRSHKDSIHNIKLLIEKLDVTPGSEVGFLSACLFLFKQDSNNINLFYDKITKMINNLSSNKKLKQEWLEKPINDFIIAILLYLSHKIGTTKKTNYEYIMSTHSADIRETSLKKIKKGKKPIHININTSDFIDEKVKNLISCFFNTKLPIHWNDYAITLLLIELTNKGKFEIDETLIDLVCQIGDPTILKEAFTHGAILQPKHFSMVASLGHTECLKLIINIKEHDFFFENTEGKTALEGAIFFNRIECVKIIVDALYSKEHNYDEKFLNKIIYKAYKLCKEDQNNIRTFLKEKLSSKEQTALTDQNPHRIPFKNMDEQESKSNENNNAIKPIEKLDVTAVKKYQRFSFFNSKTERNAIAYVKNEDWEELYKHRDMHAFEEAMLGHSKVRLVDTKHGLKFRGYGDARLLLLPKTKEIIMEIDPTQKEQPDNVEFYISHSVPKHE